MAESLFKQEHALEKRRVEAAKIKDEYPDRIPEWHGFEDNGSTGWKEQQHSYGQRDIKGETTQCRGRSREKKGTKKYTTEFKPLWESCLVDETRHASSLYIQIVFV